MRKSIASTLGLAFVAVTAAGAAPVRQKPATTPARVVKGTTQLAGDNGQIGTTYTIGADSPWNFTLKGAEFTISRVNIGEQTFAPTAEEKLLVLTFTVQNPNSGDRDYSWQSLKFSVVDGSNVTREYISDVGRTGTHEPLSMTLKPAQKVEAYAVIVVPAQGTVPKLMVEHPGGGKVLRYDLRGQIKGLSAPFADPSDATGATARREIPGEAGRYFPLHNFDVQLVSATHTTGPMGGNPPEEGKQFFVATLRLKNLTARPVPYSGSGFTAALVDADGERVEYNQHMLKGSRDEGADATLAPGAEATVRIFFELPVTVRARTLTFGEGESRLVAFDVSNMK